VIEPQETHYYQPLWTLVGAGLKTIEQSGQPMSDVLKSSTWIKDKVTEFLPSKNSVVTGSGETITYDYLVVAVGLQVRYDLVKGLAEALRNYPEVCTNYDPAFVQKTSKGLDKFEKGVALFTMNMPLKCPGAPQKIMYLADDQFRQQGKRDKAKIVYCTSSASMLGPKKYAAILQNICKDRNIECNFFNKLVEIDPKNRVATFDKLDKDLKPTGERKTVNYDFVHVGPPFSSPEILRNSKELTDTTGFLAVDKFTLQSSSFPNVFGIGDCTNLPNSKTAAAVASEVAVVQKNLRAVMEKKRPTAAYDGYSSCPIPTSRSKGIIAEFDYNLNPLETFPLDQGKERRIWYLVKAEIVPRVYWQGLVKGLWKGPAFFRKLFRFGFSK